jgi:outer membrane protein assembly factor BamB
MKTLRSTLATAIAVFCFPLSPFCFSSDWPQFLGPRGDGTSDETQWNQDWVRKEPRMLWKADVGTGCASFSIADGKAFTVGQARGGRDTVFCFDAVSGKKLWDFVYEQALAPTQYSGGPSCTPTYDEGKLFVLGRDGDLFCLDAATGKKIWQKSYVKDFGGIRQQWGFSASPVVSGDLLICHPGGRGSSIVALREATGEPVWKAGSDKAGYATPLFFQHGATSGHAFFTIAGLTGCDLSGRLLFHHPWPTPYDVNAASPQHANGHFLISSEYGTGAALIKVEGPRTQEVWRNKELMLQFQNMVLVDGFVYAVNGGNQSRATLKCLDLMTGKPQWEERLRDNRGNVLVAGGKLLVLAESGELILAQPDPKQFRQLGKVQVNRKPCWAPPAFANGLLYSRNNDGKVSCFDLR